MVFQCERLEKVEIPFNANPNFNKFILVFSILLIWKVQLTLLTDVATHEERDVDGRDVVRVAGYFNQSLAQVIQTDIRLVL